MKGISIYIILFILFYAARTEGFAQAPQSHSLVIQMESKIAWDQWVRKAQPQKAGIRWDVSVEKFNIYTLYTDSIQKQAWRKRLEVSQGVIHVESVHYATPRGYEPNDELFSEQWALPIIGATRSWYELNGAESGMGDEIVVAVLDNGFLEDHPDLENQLWINPHEIPNNGIDDDNNGYIDDISGWNFEDTSPIHPPGFHGTPVAGILGASTDNGIGIAGVAYNTKLMPLSPTGRTNTEIYPALEYVHEQRKRYNESQGQEGSFVVAANISLGIDNIFPSDAPTWCNLLDSLSEVGIIVVVSATNNPVDIAIEGDMPGLCGSLTQITATKTLENDEKDPDEGGFNQDFVHLGAPGNNIQATRANGNYGTFSGTSASAPMVSGAIALLYSSPCPELAEAAISAPRETAKKVKQLILDSTTPNESLEALTVSGGRLDIFQALIDLPKTLCQRDSADFTQIGDDFQLNKIFPNPNSGAFQFSYTPTSLSPINARIIDLSGRELWQQEYRPFIFQKQTFPVNLEHKLTNSTYIFEIEQDGKRENSLFVCID
jgi:hypothetical protein